MREDVKGAVQTYGFLAAVAAVLVAFAVSTRPDMPAYEPVKSVVQLEGCSGVAIAPHVIVTAAHCISADAATVTVKAHDKQFDPEARVLMRGNNMTGLDLAVIRTKLTLQPVKYQCDVKLKVGDELVTIGHPSGLGWTFTKAWVASVDRVGSDLHEALAQYRAIVQFSGGIAGGQSGGGLFQGETLVGITVLAFPVVEAIGGKFAPYGFAIPISTVCEALGK